MSARSVCLPALNFPERCKSSLICYFDTCGRIVSAWRKKRRESIDGSRYPLEVRVSQPAGIADRDLVRTLHMLDNKFGRRRRRRDCVQQVRQSKGSIAELRDLRPRSFASLKGGPLPRLRQGWMPEVRGRRVYSRQTCASSGQKHRSPIEAAYTCADWSHHYTLVLSRAADQPSSGSS